MSSEKRFDNYFYPKNYVCIPIPDGWINKRIREGCPFLDCSRYTVAFVVDEENNPKEVICGWPGYSYNCPIIPFWDDKTKWSVLQTDIITE